MTALWQTFVSDTFVINLDRRVDKWQLALNECQRVGLQPQRFSARTPAEAAERFGAMSLDGGNLGLNASFVEVLEATAASAPQDKWTLVFEDDVRFRRSFSAVSVSRLVSQAPAHTIAMRLGYLTGSEWRVDKSPIDNLHRLVRPRARLRAARSWVSRPNSTFAHDVAFRAGTHAIILRNSTALDLAEALAPYDEPLDHLFHRAMVANQPGTLLDVRRSLATQRSVASDIAATRAR